MKKPKATIKIAVKQAKATPVVAMNMAKPMKKKKASMTKKSMY
jgi:hypothetical protein